MCQMFFLNFISTMQFGNNKHLAYVKINNGQLSAFDERKFKSKIHIHIYAYYYLQNNYKLFKMSIFRGIIKVFFIIPTH